MGPVGSNSSAECTGIVKTRDGSKLLDNLAIRCLEEAKARPEGYAFTGTCLQTDGDGDKLYMTYEGPEGGDIALLGGTGKYKDLAGKGTWSVADAPGNTVEPVRLHADLRCQLDDQGEVSLPTRSSIARRNCL